jgi:hypothetical protein
MKRADLNINGNGGLFEHVLWAKCV